MGKDEMDLAIHTMKTLIKNNWGDYNPQCQEIKQNECERPITSVKLITDKSDTKAPNKDSD